MITQSIDTTLPKVKARQTPSQGGSSIPREAILDAAQRLIVRNGYAGLSMRELSKDSGLAKGTIYYYFQDKKAIYLNVVERDMIAAHHTISQAVQSSSDCILRLRAVVDAYFAMVRKKCSVILARLREIGGMEQELGALIKKHRHALIEPFATVLEEGISIGLFRPLNVEMAVLSLLGMMNSFVTHRLLLEQSDITDDIIDHTLEMFLRGIAVDPDAIMATLNG